MTDPTVQGQLPRDGAPLTACEANTPSDGPESAETSERASHRHVEPQQCTNCGDPLEPCPCRDDMCGKVYCFGCDDIEQLHADDRREREVRYAAALFEQANPGFRWVDAGLPDCEYWRDQADAAMAVADAEHAAAVTAMRAHQPPPPGDTREQLPAHLLALIGVPPYTSTACEAAGHLTEAEPRHPEHAAELHAHAADLHQRCRRNNKFTGARCRCRCHEGSTP